jgi:hypothetical protein
MVQWLLALTLLHKYSYSTYLLDQLADDKGDTYKFVIYFFIFFSRVFTLYFSQYSPGLMPTG